MTAPPLPNKDLPHSFEAEQSLLGSILINNGTYHRCSELIGARHFADPFHGKLFTAIGTMIDRGQQASAFALKTYVEADPDAKAAGGGRYLASLMAASVHAEDAFQAARVVRDLHVRRQLIAVGLDAVSEAYADSPERTAVEQIEHVERQLYELAVTGETAGGFQSFGRSLTASVKSAEAAHKRSGGLGGLATGLRDIDKILGGLHRSDLIIVAGRPGMGKTALATNIAFNVASAYRTKDADGEKQVIDGGVIGFFSLEMSAEQLATRIVSEQAEVPSELIRRGELKSQQFDRLISIATAVESIPLHIDDSGALTVSAIRSRARRLKRQHGLGLIIVDYLQLIGASGRNRNDNRVNEVSEITRGLKTLAKELDVPVLALSQLSRAVEQRSEKRPQLSDLRDSGSIEQDADVVMFVYREEYYQREGEKTEEAAGKAEVLIEKHRHGPTGVVHLRFDGRFTRFSDDNSRRTV